MNYTPFSNATEAMWWHETNCDVCALKPCFARNAIEKGFITGSITKKVAEFIGYTKHCKHDCIELNTLCKEWTCEPRKRKVNKIDNHPKLF